MPLNRKAGGSLAANTDTTIFQPGPGVAGSYTVSLANRTSAAINVRLGLSASGTVDWTTDSLEFDVSLPANGVIERSGIAVGNPNALHARASATGVTFVVFGAD